MQMACRSYRGWVCLICSGTHRHLFVQQAGFPQVTSHAPPGWEFLQLRARARAQERQQGTRFDNMRHRYTQVSALRPIGSISKCVLYSVYERLMYVAGRLQAQPHSEKSPTVPVPTWCDVLRFSGTIFGSRASSRCLADRERAHPGQLPHRRYSPISVYEYRVPRTSLCV
jgi:hypothetical protein